MARKRDWRKTESPAVQSFVLYPGEMRAWGLIHGGRYPDTSRDVVGEMKDAGNQIIALADLIKAERRGEVIYG